MKWPKHLAAALAFGGLMMPILAVAQTVSLTTAFFEKNKVPPRNAATLHTTIFGKTISIKALKSGSIEQVYYGAQRIDSKGIKSNYTITKAGIEEEYGGVLRMLLIYDWHGHAYACVENVGDLDELGEADGTCPYEIVGSTQDNHTEGR